jgi:hypothetical protein
MNTKFWGPPGWEFLHAITFNYPEIIDLDCADDIERQKYTERLFNDLQYTLPCKYCRESFKGFLAKEPLKPNLGCRSDLTKWLYRVHNLVNDKLRKQEHEAVESRFAELSKDVDDGKISRQQALTTLKAFVKKTMITNKDPSFSEVCEKYEGQRAGCSKPKRGIASCRSNKSRR